MSPEEAFAWMIAPVPVEVFFRDFWEKKPLHIARGDPSRHAGLLPPEVITSQLRTQPGLVYGEDINTAQCVDGEQAMHNGEGRATVASVAKATASGCSVQVVHPQRFAPAVAALLNRLEGRFGSLWGANSFRTPPASRGFKAHHDEVEIILCYMIVCYLTFPFPFTLHYIMLCYVIRYSTILLPCS